MRKKLAIALLTLCCLTSCGNKYYKVGGFYAYLMNDVYYGMEFYETYYVNKSVYFDNSIREIGDKIPIAHKEDKVYYYELYIGCFKTYDTFTIITSTKTFTLK